MTETPAAARATVSLLPAQLLSHAACAALRITVALPTTSASFSSKPTATILQSPRSEVKSV